MTDSTAAMQSKQFPMNNAITFVPAMTKNSNEIICAVVFIFASFETGIEILSLAANSRIPDTTNSRKRMAIEGITHAFSTDTSMTMIDITNTLSAIGSRQRPKFDTTLYFLAIFPSRKSVMHATAIRTIATILLAVVSIHINTQKIGTNIILIVVRIFGTLAIVIFINDCYKLEYQFLIARGGGVRSCCAARSEFFVRAEPSGSEGGLSEEVKNREGVASGSATYYFISPPPNNTSPL